MNIIREVDALQESTRVMHIFETKYGITSRNFFEGNYEQGAVSAEDKTAWKFYIRNFIKAGGQLESKEDEENCHQDELLLKNKPIYTDIIVTNGETHIIVELIKKEEAKTSSFCFITACIKTCEF